MVRLNKDYKHEIYNFCCVAIIWCAYERDAQSVCMLPLSRDVCWILMNELLYSFGLASKRRHYLIKFLLRNSVFFTTGLCTQNLSVIVHFITHEYNSGYKKISCLIKIRNLRFTADFAFIYILSVLLIVM